MIALFAVAHAEEEAAADPVAPVVYTHPFYHHMAAPVYAHHPAVYHHVPVYTHHVAPVVYAAANVCKNEGGQLVPCAHGVAPGSAIYAMADAPAMVPTVAAAPAAEAAEDVVSVEKRDAEANEPKPPTYTPPEKPSAYRPAPAKPAYRPAPKPGYKPRPSPKKPAYIAPPKPVYMG